MQDPRRPETAVYRTSLRWLFGSGLVLAVVGFYALGLQRNFSWEYFRSHRDELQNQVQEHLFLSLAVFFFLYVAVTALSLPAAAILTLVGGALFGRCLGPDWTFLAALLGTLLVCTAATLGATLAFLSSRYLFRDTIQRRWGQRLQPVHEGVEKEGIYYLFTLRLVPLFPFFLINLALGLTRMRVWPFFWVSWLGMLPGTFIYVNAGTELGNVDAPGQILSWPVLLALALMGIVPLILKKWVKFGK